MLRGECIEDFKLQVYGVALLFTDFQSGLSNGGLSI